MKPNYKVSKLQVTNFRNLEPDIISFSPNINCILGENGNGKTNILEALYYISYRKSFRKNTSFPQIISIDCEEPEIIFSSVYDNEGENFSYSGKLNMNGSTWFADGKATKKKPQVDYVFISPFDAFSFNNVPSFRRKWFDDQISLIDKQYKKVLNQYNSALRFRNTLLSKKPSDYIGQIKVIDKQMATYSFNLLQMRKKFVDQISPFIGEIYKQVFSEENELIINIDSRFLNFDEDQIYDYMQSRLDKDCAIGHTSYQVHKDDYVLLFNGMNSYEFCSLGQQKMSYLSLLFAYIELFRYIYVSTPIVLIDDVSGELDQVRWANLINYLEKQTFQVLITTANEKFKEELEKIEGANRIYITKGSIH